MVYLPTTSYREDTMKTTVKTLMLAGLFLAAMVISSQAITAEEHHHPGTEGGSLADTMPGMMMGKMQMQHTPGMKNDMPCKAAGVPCNGPCMTKAGPTARHHMKGKGMAGMKSMDHGMRGMNPGRMQQRMEREFFLDRIESLELTPDQVTKLKTIRADCRKDNIRNAAEVQIVRLDLKELLDTSDWSLTAAEPLIRKAQTLEGDMLVRHLQATAAARSVLTAEQLQKATSGEDDDLEDLFK
jgi:hypothetical protein